MAKTTVTFSVTNYSKANLEQFALLDLYGEFHGVPTTIEAANSYKFDLKASSHAIGGFVFYNRAQASELLVVMVCAAKADDIDNVVKAVCTVNNVEVTSSISGGEEEPLCTITLRDK